jgi:antitoxin component of MazEF toxin-antitoxin module
MIEIDFVKVQKRKGGSYLVTIPSEAVKTLNITDNERMKVYLDEGSKRVIFELKEQAKSKGTRSLSPKEHAKILVSAMPEESK